GSAAAGQEDDAVGDDVGRVVLLPILVVGPGLQLPFDVNRAPLGEVLRAVLGLVTPDGHAVPLGAFLTLAGFVFENLGGGDAQVAQWTAAGGVLQLGVCSQIADQDDFVDASHGRSPSTINGPKNSDAAAAKLRRGGRAPSGFFVDRAATEATAARTVA